MFLRTRASDWALALAANSTDTSFTSLVATTTEPTSNVIDWREVTEGGINQGANSINFMPFGAGNDDQTFDMRVTGWTKIGSLWIPQTLCTLSCTLSTAVGVSGSTPANTDRFADTITLTAASAGMGIDICSPGNNRPGWVTLDVLGSQKIQFTFDMTGATSGNAVYRPV